MVFNSYPFHIFFYCEDDIGFCVKYHQKINNSKYLLSLDNWYFIMWYLYWSSLHWLLLLITLSLAKKCIFFISHCLSWLLWVHLILLNLFCVISNVGRDDDPSCVYFVFKCKIINNALILGELSYIFYNVLLQLISIGIGYCWKINLFVFGT
jgi:hypothetical protein